MNFGKLSQREIFYGLAAGLVVAVAIYVSKRAGAVASAALAGINPVSDKNIFYRGTNAVGGVLAGQSDFTLGGALYDYFNPDANKVATEPSMLPVVTGGVLISGKNRDLIR